jgi:hypothetical protein
VMIAAASTRILQSFFVKARFHLGFLVLTTESLY